MKKILKTITTILLLTFMVAFLLQMASASQTINKDKSLIILSNVFGIDLNKYKVEFTGSSSTYASAFGPNMNQETIGYTLSAENSTIVADVNFVNDIFWYCNLKITGQPILNPVASTDLNNLSGTILQRYQTYASQETKKDVSYISTAQNAIDVLSAQKSTSAQVDNVKLSVSKYQTDTSNIPKETYKWSYTENGVNVNRKALSLTYTNGVLTSISDTWNLLSVGNLNSASEKVILEIAWSAAQNLTLEFTSENGSVYSIKPDLTNVTTEVVFDMQARANSTTLYPAWLITYNFAKPYNQDYGIEVGVWGDTKEVVYCHPLVLLGGSTSTDDQNTNVNGISASESILLAILVIVIIAVIVVLTLVVRNRRKK